MSKEADVVCNVRTGFAFVAAKVMEMPDFVTFAVSFQIPGGSAVLAGDCVVPEFVAFVFAFPFHFLFGDVSAAGLAPARLFLPISGATTALVTPGDTTSAFDWSIAVAKAGLSVTRRLNKE